MRALITGGSGYLGRLLIAGLVERGFDCIAVDIREGAPVGPGSTLVRGNAADAAMLLERAAGNGKIDVTFHLASQIDFAVDSQTALYDNNVGTTRAVAEFAKAWEVPRSCSTSSNSVYLGNRLKRPILENDAPEPTDRIRQVQGREREASRRLFLGLRFPSIRCPNIMDAGRLGMLSVFFDFILEGRKCWVLGRGDVRHQCIYAQDLIDACVKAISLRRTDVFNIGSDDVPSHSRDVSECHRQGRHGCPGRERPGHDRHPGAESRPSPRPLADRPVPISHADDGFHVRHGEDQARTALGADAEQQSDAAQRLRTLPGASRGDPRELRSVRQPLGDHEARHHRARQGALVTRKPSSPAAARCKSRLVEEAFSASRSP